LSGRDLIVTREKEVGSNSIQVSDCFSGGFMIMRRTRSFLINTCFPVTHNGLSSVTAPAHDSKFNLTKHRVSLDCYCSGFWTYLKESELFDRGVDGSLEAAERLCC
jgi:hypothetical protein